MAPRSEGTLLRAPEHQRRKRANLEVLELQSDGSACQRVVADDVSSYSVFFSSDSQDLVFRDGVDNCGVGRLKAADSHGSNVRLVHGSVSSDVGIGSTVFFTVPDQDSDLATPIASSLLVEEPPDHPALP